MTTIKGQSFPYHSTQYRNQTSRFSPWLLLWRIGGARSIWTAVECRLLIYRLPIRKLFSLYFQSGLRKGTLRVSALAPYPSTSFLIPVELTRRSFEVGSSIHRKWYNHMI